VMLNAVVWVGRVSDVFYARVDALRGGRLPKRAILPSLLARSAAPREEHVERDTPEAGGPPVRARVP